MDVDPGSSTQAVSRRPNFVSPVGSYQGTTYLFLSALRYRCAGLRQSGGTVFFIPTRHLPVSARCAPRDRAGLLSAVPLKRDCVLADWRLPVAAMFIGTHSCRGRMESQEGHSPLQLLFPHPSYTVVMEPLLDIYLVDGTYELFRHYYALPSARDKDGREVAAVRGVVNSVMGMTSPSGGATHIAVATDHNIESFRNSLW